MKTITRRQLNHSLAQVLDQVMTSGEPVEVVTRGGRPLVISVKAESVYDAWVRQGLVSDRAADIEALEGIEPVEIGRTSDELLAEVRGER